eukprot:7457806-Prorocentrum_lima.AAC.1
MPSRLADSGSYADRASWAAGVTTQLNAKPIMSSPFGEITPTGLQSGSYASEVHTHYNTQRQHLAKLLAKKDKNNARPVFEVGDHVLFFREGDRGRAHSARWHGPAVVTKIHEEGTAVTIQHDRERVVSKHRLKLYYPPLADVSGVEFLDMDSEQESGGLISPNELAKDVIDASTSTTVEAPVFLSSAAPLQPNSPPGQEDGAQGEQQVAPPSHLEESQNRADPVVPRKSFAEILKALHKAHNTKAVVATGTAQVNAVGDAGQDPSILAVDTQAQ